MGKILAIAKPYWFSEQKWKARGLLILLLVLSFAVNAINVSISFIFRNIDTALATFLKLERLQLFGDLLQSMLVY